MSWLFTAGRAAPLYHACILKYIALVTYVTMCHNSFQSIPYVGWSWLGVHFVEFALCVVTFSELNVSFMKVTYELLFF